MEKMTLELKNTQKEVENIKERTTELENSTKEIVKQQEQQQILEWNNELRYRDRCIKIRGISEKSNEDLSERLIPELAKHIDIPEERMSFEIDKIFRINSVQVREKKLPRDIVICFVRTKLRDIIIQKNYEVKFMVEEEEAKIYKDIPQQILSARLKYSSLTQVLKYANINYRWERLEGLSFYYNQKRYKIDSEEKALEIERKIKREFKEKEEGKKEKHSFKREWRATHNKEKTKEKGRSNQREGDSEEIISAQGNLLTESNLPLEEWDLLYDLEN